MTSAVELLERGRAHAARSDYAGASRAFEAALEASTEAVAPVRVAALRELGASAESRAATARRRRCSCGRWRSQSRTSALTCSRSPTYLGALHAAAGRRAAAAACYRRAIAILEPAVEPDHPTLVACREDLAALGE